MAQAPQLDYAPARPPWHLRRRTRIALIVLALAVLIGWAGRHPRQLAHWANEKFIYFRDARRIARCMNYEAPPEEITLERDPQQVVPLVNSGRYRHAISSNSSPGTAMAMPPQPWQDLWGGMGGRNSAAVSFLHERKTPTGKVGLVMIECSLTRSSVGPHFAVTLIEPGSLDRRWRHFGPAVACTIDPPMRVFFGEPDAADPSHFTIRTLRADGQEQTYDGWLRDPGPSAAAWEFAQVIMTPRPRAASSPQAPPP